MSYVQRRESLDHVVMTRVIKALCGLVSCLPMLVESTSRRRAENGSFLLVERKIGSTKMGRRWATLKIGWEVGCKKDENEQEGKRNFGEERTPILIVRKVQLHH